MNNYSSISPEPPNPGRQLDALNTALQGASVERGALGELTTVKTNYTSQRIFQEIRECQQGGLTQEQINTAIDIVQTTKDLFSAKAYRKAGIAKEADRLIANLTLRLTESQPSSDSQLVYDGPQKLDWSKSNVYSIINRQIFWRAQ